jgi:hypothetical protein
MRFLNGVSWRRRDHPREPGERQDDARRGVLADDPAVFPMQGDEFLDIPGPRWDYPSDAGRHYGRILAEVRVWLAPEPVEARR